jgi:hypothetical protein
MTTTQDPATSSAPKANKVGIAAVFAAVACAVACAAPLLLAGGLFAGIGTLFTNARVVAPVILASTGAAYFWLRRRRAGNC